MKSTNPYTNTVIANFKEHTNHQVDQILSSSVKAFDKWRLTSFDDRKNLLKKVAGILTENTDTFARNITEEMGKPIRESRAEIQKCAWVCQHFANDAELLLQKEAVFTDAHKTYITYEPLGAILGIMPWNYPFWQVFRFAAPTLMAGNTVVLKHASNVQMCAKIIASIFEKAGLPKGIFQVVRLNSERVSSLVEAPEIKAVTLTGSNLAGSHIAAIAGKNIKKTVLELGGNNAFVVFKDADIKHAINIGLNARMHNAGQSCIAAKRFIVHKDVIEQYIEQYTEKLKALNMGNPVNVQTDLGPLASVKHVAEVARQVNESVKKGAEVFYGGYSDNAFYVPTVVKNVKPGMPLFDQEVFGPVASFTAFSTEQEAITLANDSKYGLGTSLFTTDINKAENLAPRFEDGAVFINEKVKSDPRLPFGGTKQSGYGRELAAIGIKEFVNIKTVFVHAYSNSTPTSGEKKVPVKSMGSAGNF